jgi:N-acetylmuramic acid 6-phosphate etherase
MTHDRLQKSLDIDRASTTEIVEIIQSEDAKVAEAVSRARREIIHAVDEISERLREGGRLFYAGAGTSGRIAMLDASELPPTFGVSPETVQVLMAGGTTAFVSAAEGAEDKEEDAVRAVDASVTEMDCVFGIAASGTTPFTVAAVRRANMVGALTVGLTSRAGSPLAREVDIPIVIDPGPEVVMGSSRMKNGTVQKLVLNTISTATMIRLGRVYSNLMVDMPATNAKLRERAVEMVRLASGATRKTAATALDEAKGDVRLALVIAARNLSVEEAEEILQTHDGNLREILTS